MSSIRLLLATLTALLIAPLAAPVALAGSGSVVSLPLPGVKVKTGLRLNIDGRGIDANGYRPVRVEAMPLIPGPFPADRQLRVVLRPGNYSAGNPEISQIIELPEGANSATTTIAVPQTSQWYQFSVETYEGGEKLKDLSQDYLGWTNNGYWQWTEASPALLFIDDRIPPRNKRDSLVVALQSQGLDPQPTHELPDIRTLIWMFPDPNRGNFNWSTTTTASGVTTLAQVSDTTLLMQIQSQMGRVEMLPLAELHERWIDMSQFDVAVISSADLRQLAEQHPKRAQALRDWLRGGAVLLVYDAGEDFERLAQIEKNLALSPLPEVSDGDEEHRGWKLPDKGLFQRSLQSTWNMQGAYIQQYPGGPLIAANSNGYDSQATQQSPGAATLQAPDEPPFLRREVGLGMVVAIAARQPFPGKETDWSWIFNSLPANQWCWYQRNGFSMYRENDDYWTFLIPGVGEAPVISFLLLVSLFAAVIGPVNYILLGKARRLYLLLITVPAGALIITVSLFAYALFTDGLGVRLRARSFIDLDQAAGHAAGWSRQSYYASIAPSRGLQFPEDCTVFGIAHKPANGEPSGSRRTVLEWDGQQTLETGYIASRTSVQYMVQRSTKSEAKLNVRSALRAGEGPQVENRLGADVEYLLLRDRRGEYFSAANLAKGKSASLTASSVGAAEKEFRRIAKDVQPAYPAGFDPTVRRESVLTFIMPNYSMWGGIDSGNTRPAMATGLLETKLAVALSPSLHPPQPGTYIAILKTNPFIPAGVPNPREAASLHVLRGHW